MKRILVPCDFSIRSREAYKTAMNLASRTGGEVIVLNAFFIPAVYDFSYTGETLAFNPEYLTNLEKDAHSEFEKMKQEANFPSVRSKLEIVYGDVAFSIKNFAKENKIDMIIMGTSGSSGLEEIFIGSVTEKVVRHSPVPVLAVREYVDVASIKKILFPTLLNLDLTDFMKKLKDLQQFLKASLHILFVNSPGYFLRDSDAKEAFDEFAKQYDLENYEFHFRNYRNEEEGIVDFATSQKIDLIAHGHTRPQRPCSSIQWKHHRRRGEPHQRPRLDLPYEEGIASDFNFSRF